MLLVEMHVVDVKEVDPDCWSVLLVPRGQPDCAHWADPDNPKGSLRLHLNAQAARRFKPGELQYVAVFG